MKSKRQAKKMERKKDRIQGDRVRSVECRDCIVTVYGM